MQGTKLSEKLKLARYFIILLSLILPLVSVATPLRQLNTNPLVKIAVIDTGFDYKSTWANINITGLVRPKLCKTGSKDFTGFGLQDTNGHGTHIAGLIAKYAKNSNYCLVIIKDFSSQLKDMDNANNEIKAFKYALKLKVNIINYSGGGVNPMEAEKKVINKVLKAGIVIVAAAGNNSSEMSKKGVGKENGLCNYYPACYSSLIASVGSFSEPGLRAPYSNYGSAVNAWQVGSNVFSLGLNNSYAIMSGTSQATAIQTGKIVYNFYKFYTKKHSKANKTKAKLAHKVQ